jgi:CrcB protein
MIYLAVAAGGAFGALARYLIMSLVGKAAGPGFPWGTLAVNVLGCFIMGLLVELFAARLSVTQETRAFLQVGFLGALTTFSSFALDVGTLLDESRPMGGLASWGPAAGYIVASVALSVGAFLLAMHLFRPHPIGG